jgi:hypothetical protein
MLLVWLCTDGFAFYIDIFSRYFVLVGGRYALNRKGTRVVLTVRSWGKEYWERRRYICRPLLRYRKILGITLPFVFGKIALLSGQKDYLRLRQGSVAAFTVQNVAQELSV